MSTLITAHANADFDAFAAMLAARRLHDDNVLLFPGTQEKSLQKVYNNLDRQHYNFMEAAEIPWAEIDRLVLVDTRQKGRLRHIAPLLEREGLEIEIWDHHPDSGDDVQSPKTVVASVGASTSLLCAELEKRGIVLTGEEATFLGLGIYADTGSFTYSSTTRDDFLAAAWLLGQGMDVNEINEMASHQLTGMHIQALNSLMESARTYVINDVPVVLAETSLDNYLGDFAYLAHQLMEMEKFTVLFTIGRMGDRIQVVARSRNDAVNVGDVCAKLGGGGHSYAASASVRGKMITEVRDIIVNSLEQQGQPVKTAREYMSAPAIGVESEATIREADELMLHFGLKAIPVFKPGTRVCCGLLDAQTAARANAHGLGREIVAEYMKRRVETLSPRAGIRDLARVIVAGRQRLVPIVEKGAVSGVVTRTDLINVFASGSGKLEDLQKKNSRPRNVRKLMNGRLLPETRRILELAGNLGRKLKLPVYAVGGFVRDLLIGRSNQDIDLVVEGDGIGFARALAAELGGRVREHQKFLTSIVIYHDDEGSECHVDVATARLEYYEYPAALPTVELSSIKMDLFRRDFSINALAVRLDCDPPGELEDFFGGRRDIQDKVIRVLHTLSFVEDPTRALRAARFEQRYQFHIGPGTEKLIRNILPLNLLEKLSPQRVFNEFRHICEEEYGAKCLIRLDDLGVLPALGRNLALTPQRAEILQQTRKVLGWHKMLWSEDEPEPWVVYFLSLNHNLSYADTSHNYDRLGFAPANKNMLLREREIIRKLRPRLLAWQKKEESRGAKISEFCCMLAPLSLESLLYLMAICDNPALEKNISRHITHWRHEKADINGDDLRGLGLTPGPAFAIALKAALDAKLDGQAPTAKAQMAVAAKAARKAEAEKDKNHHKE